jgi:hypothetical protein
MSITKEFTLPLGYEETDMTDVQFSEWLREKGWEGKVSKLGEFSQFFIPINENKIKVLAIVKYKNSCPLNRWIYVNVNV